MPTPKPGTPEYEEMVEFMRADLLSGFEHTKQVNALVEMTRKQMAAQGKDFDQEFDEWKKQRKEVLVKYDIKIYKKDGPEGSTARGLTYAQMTALVDGLNEYDVNYVVKTVPEVKRI